MDAREVARMAAEQCGLEGEGGCEEGLRALESSGAALRVRFARRLDSQDDSQDGAVEVSESLALNFRRWLGPAAGLLLALGSLGECLSPEPKRLQASTHHRRQ